MSIEAEMSVLGGAILDLQCAHDAADALAPEMFFHDHTRKIFEKISDLYWAGKPIDSTVLMSEMPEEKVTLVKLAQYIPTLSHYGDYLRIVQDDWQLNNLDSSLFALSQSGGSLEDKLGDLEALVSKHKELSGNRTKDGITSFAEAAQEFQMWLRERQEENPKSGYASLDRATGGFMTGSVFVIAARPGCGKTDFAVNLALRMAKQEKRVLYFSMEMTNVQLMQRVASHLLKINSQRVRDRILSDDEMKKVEWALSQFESKQRLSFVQEPRVSVKRVRHYIDLWKPDVVIVDHIGLMDRPKARDQYRAIGEISNELKQIALEKKISLIELVQMNRAIESRASKVPTLADLRESGDLEQDADYVGFLVPENMSEKTLVGDESADIVLYLQKNRHGRPGNFRYRWQPQYHRFAEVETRYG